MKVVRIEVVDLVWVIYKGYDDDDDDANGSVKPYNADFLLVGISLTNK